MYNRMLILSVEDGQMVHQEVFTAKSTDFYQMDGEQVEKLLDGETVHVRNYQMFLERFTV